LYYNNRTYLWAIENTTFNETMIVAGTKRTRRAPRTEEMIVPISMPRIAASRTSPWIPAKLTITKDSEARRKVWMSFSATKYPTIIPNNAKTPNIKGLVLIWEKLVITPTATARTTPAKKAHAPIKFSRDFIGIFPLFLY